MLSLVFDNEKEGWDSSKGFLRAEVPEPVLDEIKNPADADAIIVKVQYAGICGTDKGIWHRQAFKEQILGSLEAEKKSVRILGHEIFGEIVKIGSDVERIYGIKVGDKGTCESHVVCNRCFQCQGGEKNVCINEKILGISHDGGFAEYLKVPAHIFWKTDIQKIRPEVAAMQEPFGNAVHAVCRADVRGKNVVILGLGPIGLFAVLVAKAEGAKKIIGVEPNPEAHAMAEKLGIDVLISPDLSTDFHRDEKVVARVLEETGGIGADVALEMAGSNRALNTAIFSARRGGMIILFGIKNQDFVIENYNQLIVKGVRMKAIIGRHMWRTWERTRDILEDPKEEAQKLMWEVILNGGKDTIIPISEYDPATFESLMMKHPKLLIKFD